MSPFAASHLSILGWIDAGRYHARDARGVRGEVRAFVQRELVARGLVRLLERRGRFPRRYVTTAAGSHALGTFDHA